MFKDLQEPYQANYYVRVGTREAANLIFRSTLEPQDVLFTSSL
jgi:hypothetical protein